MTVYIALLRGINVGGHKKIKMTDLKQMLEAMGLARVQTYIQSGNVVFESEEAAGSLQTKIETEIEKVFGFSVAVMLRTSEELMRVIENSPFSFDSLGEGESIHVSFLAESPAQEEIDRLSQVTFDIDEYQFKGREIYMLLRQRMPDSKLPIHLQKVSVPATVRNWKTVLKLGAMVQA